MASQIALIEVFRDTQIQIKENKRLIEDTKRMQAGTRLYLDQFEAVIAEVKSTDPGQDPEYFRSCLCY